MKFIAKKLRESGFTSKKGKKFIISTWLTAENEVFKVLSDYSINEGSLNVSVDNKTFFVTVSDENK